MTTPVCDDSKLCAELAGETQGIAFHELCGGDPPSRILHESEHFAVMADLAPLVEGHLLIVPRWHALSFGQVPPGQWTELREVLAHTVEVVTREYGAPLVLEHGSSSATTFSACVSHAHWHIVPVVVDLTDTFEADGLNGYRLQELQDLVRLGAADASYIFYFNTTDNDMRVYLSGLSKRHQYLRVVVAEHIGIPDPEWDWGYTQRLDLLRQTVRRLKGLSWQ